MIMGDYHGDEPEIEIEYCAIQEAYENEHSSDWKYLDERVNDAFCK